LQLHDTVLIYETIHLEFEVLVCLEFELYSLEFEVLEQSEI